MFLNICYWDLLGDIQVLGYDISKVVNLFYVDRNGTLKRISNDSEIVVLTEQVRKQIVVDVYVESTGVSHKEVLPEILRPGVQEKLFAKLLSTGGSSASHGKTLLDVLVTDLMIETESPNEE